MAERRMFSRSVTESDLFTDMPLTAQALYFHLGINADDDGFVGSPNTIRRSIGATTDDYKILLAKGFLIPFPSGVVVITHWTAQNKVQPSRKIPTIYKNELAELSVSNGVYTAVDNASTDCRQIADKAPQSIESIGKDSIGSIGEYKGSAEGGPPLVPPPAPSGAGHKTKRFEKPLLEDVKEYYIQRGSTSDQAERFFDYYESKGWKIGTSPMKDWQAAARNWIRKDGGNSCPADRETESLKALREFVRG